jgi:hypothetical protein
LRGRVRSPGDANSYLVLKLKDIVEKAVEPIGPKMRRPERVNQSRCDPHAAGPFRTEPSSTCGRPSLRPACDCFALVCKNRVAGDSKSQRMRLGAVMISSTMPSAKYSCSGSPLVLAKGRTVSGNGS